jgi:hypothetical protein
MSDSQIQDDSAAQPPPAPWGARGWKYGAVNALIILHLAALLLMVAGGGTGTFSSPPLVARASAVTAPYVRFTGMQNAYRFFAPDPGPATLIWARLTYDDGKVRWIECPGRESHPRSLAYHRELYPAMMLGMQTAPPGALVVPGYPHLTDIGFTYAFSYVRHLAAASTRTGDRGTPKLVRTVELFVVTHAIRTPSQVRQGWRADDLRLYQTTKLGEFRADGTLQTPAISAGHEKPAILEVAERMVRDATGAQADVAGPDLPSPLRHLLTEHPELRDTTDTRPLQMRIGHAYTSRDKPDNVGQEEPRATPR